MHSDQIDWWDQALEVLSNDPKLGQSNLAFIRLATPLTNLNGSVLLAVPNEYTANILENRVKEPIIRALQKVSPEIHDFTTTIEPDIERFHTDFSKTEYSDPHTFESEENNTDFSDRLINFPGAVKLPELAEIDDEDAELAHLNTKYTFDTFVIGPSNRFAHAAATAVAETPARAYNPLFIYGGSGLGKTHLLHAIGHYSMKLYPGTKVRYVNSEEFTNDFINSVSAGKAHDFQSRYRNVDILLIDDIQFLQGKEQTVEEFFHTFNSLHNDNKQVVITSDVPPKKLDGFEERLRSRFEWGLTTDVQPPDLETRMAILRNKTRYEGFEAEDAVLEYIASRFQMNIRELEGALVRVTAFASLTNQKVSLPVAEMVLKDIISSPNSQQITATLVKDETAKYFGVSVEQLCSSSRSRLVTEARQSAMYVCRELTDLSLPQIGKEFGGRDHTTVIHANRKISQNMQTDQKVFNQITELTNRVRQAAQGPAFQ